MQGILMFNLDHPKFRIELYNCHNILSDQNYEYDSICETPRSSCACDPINKADTVPFPFSLSIASLTCAPIYNRNNL